MKGPSCPTRHYILPSFPFSHSSSSSLPTREADGCARDVFSVHLPSQSSRLLLPANVTWMGTALHFNWITDMVAQWVVEDQADIFFFFLLGCGDEGSLDPTCAIGNLWARAVYLLFAWHFACDISYNSLHMHSLLQPRKDTVVSRITDEELKVP